MRHHLNTAFYSFVVQRQALGLAVRLTLSGNNQLGYASTWAYLAVVLICILTQMNYLNKVPRACCAANVPCPNPFFHRIVISIS